MIKQIRKQLDDVPYGGWFFIDKCPKKTYCRTDHGVNGHAVVVDLRTGELANFMTALTVVEISKGGE